MSQQTSNIYILYNADASILGKLSYACRKLTVGPKESPCAACDLTHGGLKLDESPKWKQTKQQIGGATVKQLHRDELTSELRDFVSSNRLRYPLVVGQAPNGSALKVLIDSESLPSVSADHSAFLSLLKKEAADKDVPISILNTSL
ncbi:uncharacterized protein A1O9_12456 [Exophiala aquamarina CBS 119918]|uniref:Uncharacterized protein n=1 Tax=Exophiala aquamarina CBS 119918 TaxID=1182545 RepID=A0A072NUI6_9EURO|nr:uncharacterized protein A1O9_12456 [Exophiala aquamarina CBS 119918]KEF51539.1 hypothetical protein A1O9_12456 [Exophiala aquamarina CBS 119918]